jgi:hypothetical protein
MKLLSKFAALVVERVVSIWVYGVNCVKNFRSVYVKRPSFQEFVIRHQML